MWVLALARSTKQQQQQAWLAAAGGLEAPTGNTWRLQVL